MSAEKRNVRILRVEDWERSRKTKVTAIARMTTLLVRHKPMIDQVIDILSLYLLIVDEFKIFALSKYVSVCL